MGASHAKLNQAQPAPQPLAILKTETGMIARVNDPASGGLQYVHNPRNVPSVSLIASLEEVNPVPPQQGVLMARPGSANTDMKQRVVYVKRPPRQPS